MSSEYRVVCYGPSGVLLNASHVVLTTMDGTDPDIEGMHALAERVEIEAKALETRADPNNR
jgi:hypothetical protein